MPDIDVFKGLFLARVLAYAVSGSRISVTSAEWPGEAMVAECGCGPVEKKEPATGYGSDRAVPLYSLT